MPPNADNSPERFWRFVPDRPDEPDACWVWWAAYGGRPGDKRAPMYRGRSAVRMAWILDKGEEPPRERLVQRACGNYRCVRPSHLRVGRKPKPQGPGCGTWGESNGKARLSDDQVARIRVLYERGATQQQLADYYGVSQVSVSNWVLGLTRRAAGGPTRPSSRRVMNDVSPAEAGPTRDSRAQRKGKPIG